MSFYDAYASGKGTGNQNNVSSNKGLKVKAFGDAFTGIANVLEDSEKRKRETQKHDALMEINSLEKQQLENTIDKQEDTQNKQDFTDAYSKEYMQFNNKDEWENHKNNTSSWSGEDDSLDYSNASAKDIKDENAYFQKKSNYKAIKSSYGAKSYEEWKANNPDSFRDADTATIDHIKKSFDTTKQNKKIIEDAQKELETKQKLANKDAQIRELKQNKTNNKTKQEKEKNLVSTINSRVKTYLGLDSKMSNWDEDEQKKYTDISAGILDIAKKKNINAIEAQKEYFAEIEKQQEEKKVQEKKDIDRLGIR